MINSLYLTGNLHFDFSLLALACKIASSFSFFCRTAWILNRATVLRRTSSLRSHTALVGIGCKGTPSSVSNKSIFSSRSFERFNSLAVVGRSRELCKQTFPGIGGWAFGRVFVSTTPTAPPFWTLSCFESEFGRASLWSASETELRGVELGSAWIKSNYSPCMPQNNSKYVNQ